jgi:hypothetical protein
MFIVVGLSLAESIDVLDSSIRQIQYIADLQWISTTSGDADIVLLRRSKITRGWRSICKVRTIPLSKLT